MRERIEAFAAQHRVAVVGASRKGKKFGNAAAKALAKRGYEVHLVHPVAETIDEQPCAPSLAALAGQVEAVLVCVPADKGGEVLRDAAAAGVRHVWLQQGAESQELIDLSKSLGLAPVVGRCVLMFAGEPTGLHRFHRGMKRMFGSLYPKDDPFAAPSAEA